MTEALVIVVLAVKWAIIAGLLCYACWRLRGSS